MLLHVNHVVCHVPLNYQMLRHAYIGGINRRQRRTAEQARAAAARAPCEDATTFGGLSSVQQRALPALQVIIIGRLH